MAWEKRAGQSFYYRSRKKQGRVVREYLGRGTRAVKAAAEDTERQVGRNKERIEKQAWDDLETHITTLNRLTTSLSQALLVDAGFYKHRRGAWRKRRNNGPYTTNLS